MTGKLILPDIQVNCRVGSLEIKITSDIRSPAVNCRVGSLEKTGPAALPDPSVNCRVGSLEI